MSFLSDSPSELKTTFLDFLEHLQDPNQPGYFRYSYSGDFFDASKQENIAGSIFALKMYYMLGVTDQQIIQPIIDRVLLFQKNDGSIYDPFVFRKSFVRNALANLKHGNFDKMDNHQYVRAETRQAYSALLLHEVIPEKIYSDFPTEPFAISKFMRSLDWSKPWGAGSHFSHLMFFLSLLQKSSQLDVTAFQAARHAALEELASLHHETDGAWYVGNPSALQKINGVMKVMTGLLWMDAPIICPKKLIDLCLSHKDPIHACDQFNKTMVLRYANEAVHGAYKRKELTEWCEKTLEEWQEYYHPEQGGFSFWKGRANARYYDAQITRGLNGADIHGTVLFVWGLSMMAKLAPIPELNWLNEMKS